MELEFEEYAKIAQFDFLKSQTDLLPGWSWDCGSTTARDKFPQEIWLKIFSYLESLDVGKCAQVCKWMQEICLDRSLKYHEIQNIYQTTSSRFIKTLFHFKETELLMDLMRSAPDFWSIDSCWHNRIMIRKWTLSVEVIREWHESVANHHRNQMAAIL